MDHCSVQVCWFPCSESRTQISCWQSQRQDLVKSDLYMCSPVRNVTGNERRHAQINPPKNCVIYTIRPCLSSLDCILGQWLLTLSSLFVSINLKAGMQKYPEATVEYWVWGSTFLCCDLFWGKEQFNGI